MAKIIQFKGVYYGLKEYEVINLNADIIRKIYKSVDSNNQPVTVIEVGDHPIICTKLSIEEVIKLVNG